MFKCKKENMYTPVNPTFIYKIKGYTLHERVIFVQLLGAASQCEMF